jgi:hypothetical protein
VADVWCYILDRSQGSRGPTGPHSLDVGQANTAFEARIVARRAAAEGTTGQALKLWAQGCCFFPLVQQPRSDILSWGTPCERLHPVMPLAPCHCSRLAARLG